MLAVVVALGLGDLAGGALADRAGLLTAFMAAAIVSALPVFLLPRWTAAAEASAEDRERDTAPASPSAS